MNADFKAEGMQDSIALPEQEFLQTAMRKIGRDATLLIKIGYDWLNCLAHTYFPPFYKP